MSASILVVEDEEPIQILLSYNLESEGYRARHTAQGEEVPRLVSEERPDLILLDWMLPGIGDLSHDRLEIDKVLALGAARIEVQRGTRRFFVTASLP